MRAASPSLFGAVCLVACGGVAPPQYDASPLAHSEAGTQAGRASVDAPTSAAAPITVVAPPPASAVVPAAPLTARVTAMPDMKQAMGNYGLVFQSSGHGWVNQVVIAPWGDVLARGDALEVLDRTTGKTLLRTPVCFAQTKDGAVFVDATHLWVGCEDGIDEITYPEGSTRRVKQFDKERALSAFSANRLVIAADGFFVKNDPIVHVLSTTDLSEVDSFDAGAAVSAVGVSADGDLVAAGTESAGLTVRSVSKKASQRYLEKSSSDLRPVHFSPKGDHLFSDTSAFNGGELNLKTGNIDRSFKVSSWISAIRYRDDTTLFVTDAEGMMLLGGTPSEVRSPIGDLGEGLDLSTDGSYVCAAGRGGEVACFSNKPVAPSTFAQPAIRPTRRASPSRVTLPVQPPGGG